MAADERARKKARKAQLKRFVEDDQAMLGGTSKKRLAALNSELRTLAEAAGWPRLSLKVMTLTSASEPTTIEHSIWAQPVSIGAGQQEWEGWLATPPIPAEVEARIGEPEPGRGGFDAEVRRNWANAARYKAWIVLQGRAFWGPDENGTIPGDLAGLDLSGLDFSGVGVPNDLLVRDGPAPAWLAFVEANCEDADFSDTQLPRAKFWTANLTGANFEHASVEHAQFQHANLTGANLSGATLKGSVFQGAQLTRANCREADLRGADLRDADLTGADLTGARISAGVLGLGRTELSGAKWSGTRCPDGTDSDASPQATCADHLGT